MLINLAWARLGIDDTDTAVQLASEGVEISRARRTPISECRALLILARCHLARRAEAELMAAQQHIEEALVRCGYHLCSKLIYKLARALYYYTEENQRSNSGCVVDDHNDTRIVFMNRYQHRDHSCADHRPEHWRRYL